MGTSTSHLWVYWIIFGHLFNPSYSLVVHLFNLSNHETTSEITFKSQYTSLGTPPKHQPLRSNLVYLSSYNFSDCSFSQATNIPSIKGSIVLLESTPPWHPCAHAEAGMAPALGRMIQKVGGIGVLTASLEKFCDGCILGYEPSVLIPFIVIPSSTIQYLIDNKEDVLYVDFPTISESDSWFLQFMAGQYLESIIVISVLNLVVIVLFGFTLYDDIITCPKGSINWHGIFLKLLAICSSAVAILYLTVDPFNFKGYYAWNSHFVLNLYVALYTVLVMMLLQLWIVATGSNTSKIVKSKFFAHAGTAALTMLVAFIQGLIPAISSFNILFTGLECVMVVMCQVGLVFFGTNIVYILRRGGNVSHEHDPLTRKIIIFIIIYVTLNDATAITWMVAPMGLVMSLMFALFGCCTLILAAVLILFLPPIVQRKRRERRLSLAMNIESAS